MVLVVREDPATSALDETTMQGFSVVNFLNEFTVRNSDPITQLPIAAGKTEVEAVVLPK